MIDAPLYDNPLAGGISATPGIGGGTVSDTADRTIQDPYEIGGGGQLGLASAIDGSGGGALFLPDENRPRSEEHIRNRYEQAKAQAAESRRNGFLGQVILPGEMKYEDFKNMQNSFFLKRNPNIPESAYDNFDLTNVGGFDNPTMDASMKGLPETNEPPMFATPGLPPQQEEIPGARDLIETIGTVKGPEDTLFDVANNPYNRVGQQLMGPNQDEMLGTLKNIEQGIASLVGNYGQDFNSNKSSNYGDFDNFGIGSFFPPYGGMYG